MPALTLSQLDTQLRQLMADNRPGPQEYSTEMTYKAINWAVVEMCKRNSFSYRENSFSVSATGLISMPTPVMSIVRVLPVTMSVSITTPKSSAVFPVNTAMGFSAIAVTGIAGSPADGPYTYTWTWNDGTANTIGQTVNHTWTTSHNQTATVLATNTGTGQSASASVTVVIVSRWTTETATFVAQPSTGTISGSWSFALDSTRVMIIITNPNSNCYIYDSSLHTISKGPSLPGSSVSQLDYSTCVLSDGRVLINGGGSWIKMAFMYTPSTNSWSRVADRNYGVVASFLGSVQMNNGNIFAAGVDAYTIAHDEVYNPTLNTWTTLPSRPAVATGNNVPSVCIMSDGRVFLGPGISNSSTACVAWDPVAGSWSTLATCPFGNACIFSLTGTTKLIAISLSTNFYAIYDLSNNTWSAQVATPFTVSNQGSYSLMANGLIAAIMPGSKTAYVYSAASSSWSAYPSVNLNHERAPIVSLASTMVVIGSYLNSDTGAGKVEYLN